MTLDFGKLPLIEVAARVAFQAPIALTYEAVYAIHNRMKDQFPSVSTPNQIEIAPGIGPSPDQSTYLTERLP